MRDRFDKSFFLSNCVLRAVFLVVCALIGVFGAASRVALADGFNFPILGLSQGASQTLKAHNLSSRPNSAQIDEILAQVEKTPTRDLICAYVEAGYAEARRQETFRPRRALDCYASVALYAWRVLFDASLRSQRDASIFSASDFEVMKTYNGACERLLFLVLRDVSKEDILSFRNEQTIELHCESKNLLLKNIARFGSWKPEELGAFQLASSVKVEKLDYVCRRNGIGTPLVAYRSADASINRPEEAYYSEGIRFPATAIIRPNPEAPLGALPPLDPNARDREFPSTEPIAFLEIYDSISAASIIVDGREVPLCADLTTPLASYLSSNVDEISSLAKQGLFKPELLQTTWKSSTTVERSLQGLYMFEPYDPDKIPVVMIHGLGSAPITWLEMYNALNSAKEIQNAFQFWFFFYPTGQPFWISAAQFRSDFAKLRETVDPRRTARALDQTVLIGHSMGGLIARMQVQSSGTRLWERASSKSLEELNLDAETTARLRSWFFFEPDPSIKRVITLATPFKGSNYANDFTQWVAGQAIAAPQVVSKVSSFISDGLSGKSSVPTLLQTTTSVDSLSPNSPIFAALDECPIPSNVALNNIVGVLDYADKRLIAPKKTDGVVEFSSSHRDDVESEKIVSESHSYVQTHPASILEVKEILLRHRDKAREEIAKNASTATR